MEQLRRLTADERIKFVSDERTFREMKRDYRIYDPISFDGYQNKIREARKRTGLDEAVVTGSCKINGFPCVMMVMDSRFMMGSMGSAVGEKICSAFESATAKKLPVICFSASGGARMQEGLFSLFQMSKTSGAIKAHHNKKLLYISVITDPTMGGVSASFASLADIILAEPEARYGFTGERIIRDTIVRELPSDFQSAEYAMKHGAVDRIVHREELKDTLGFILSIHRG